MSVLVAVASDDGINVNMHFGWAHELLIYKVEEDGTYNLVDERVVPELRRCETPVETKQDDQTDAEGSENERLGNKTQTTNSSTGEQIADSGELQKGSIKRFLEQSGVGCGNGHSCGENFKDTDVDKMIETFADCKYILALKVGRVMERIFKTKEISCFSVDLPIDEALQSIAVYEKRKSTKPAEA